MIAKYERPMTNGQNGQNGQKKRLETQLWNIADSLRGKMNADEFRDYFLGFIFYKYLSERQHLYANEILAEDEVDFLIAIDQKIEAISKQIDLTEQFKKGLLQRMFV